MEEQQFRTRNRILRGLRGEMQLYVFGLAALHLDLGVSRVPPVNDNRKRLDIRENLWVFAFDGRRGE